MIDLFVELCDGAVDVTELLDMRLSPSRRDGRLLTVLLSRSSTQKSHTSGVVLLLRRVEESIKRATKQVWLAASLARESVRAAGRPPLWRRTH
eukprot:3717287-Prymnesium_polylepis.1